MGGQNLGPATGQGVRRFVRYVLVGVVSYGADVGVLYGLVEYAGVNYRVAAAVSYVLVTALNFQLNKTWAFRSRESAGREALRYLSLAAVNATVTIAWLHCAVEWLGIGYLTAKLAVMSAIVVWNYFLYRTHVYGPREPGAGAARMPAWTGGQR